MEKKEDGAGEVLWRREDIIIFWVLFIISDIFPLVFSGKSPFIINDLYSYISLLRKLNRKRLCNNDICVYIIYNTYIRCYILYILKP